MKNIYIPKETLSSIKKAKLKSQQILNKVMPFVSKINSLSIKVAEASFKWQSKNKVQVIEMAKRGWFPNWYTFLDYSVQDLDSIDEFMVTHLDECMEEMKEKVHELVPNRKHIIDVIFKLHGEKNYIASIPLILSQSDGIVSEEFGSFFSGRNKAPQKILQSVKNGIIVVDFFTEYLLEPFKIENLQISSWSENAAKFKEKGPNRHGILHGCKEHLDYGTKLNGYKALSFLVFLIYTTKDEFKPQK